VTGASGFPDVILLSAPVIRALRDQGSRVPGMAGQVGPFRNPDLWSPIPESLRPVVSVIRAIRVP
jgi:hypothetical protein